MSADSFTLAVAYLLFGFIASFLLRRGRAEDWDESLLASILAPILLLLVVAAVLGERVWDARDLRVTRRGRS